MTALRPEIDRTAVSDAKVLITGESGVGKEVVARLIHALSRRSRTSLVAINCAGIPETLLETELFGHVKGSFTGAYRDKPGLLELAHRGTIFLDEVGEMTGRMQSLLLRFLETGELQRVGSTRSETRVDVRVIAATNRDLVRAVSAGGFRQELFYRLNVIHVHVPPLRDRVEDIPALLAHFTRSCSARAGVPPPSYTSEATAILQAYQWPGNVRELKNVVERLVVRVPGGTVEPEYLPSEVHRTGEDAGAGSVARSRVVDLIYEQLIRQRQSFWSVVYAPFMLRDLTRDDIRALITRGLEETSGNHRMLTKLFNMEDADYRRLLNFLRKHQCHMPFEQFHRPSARLDRVEPAPQRSSNSEGRGPRTGTKSPVRATNGA